MYALTNDGARIFMTSDGSEKLFNISEYISSKEDFIKLLNDKELVEYNDKVRDYLLEVLTKDERIRLYGVPRGTNEDKIPLFEGFLTYGGISVREIEAMTVGLYETLDETMISQSPNYIKYLVEELEKRGVPMVTPPGVLGAHVNAMKFCEHIPQDQYPAGALAAAFYICSGIRGMERGTVSSTRDENGNEIPADVELLRLAVPRRVFTLSQINYVIDRMHWLYDNRHLIGGLRFVYEPKVLRFFMGGLEPTSNWPNRLMEKFREDFGDSL